MERVYKLFQFMNKPMAVKRKRSKSRPRTRAAKKFAKAIGKRRWSRMRTSRSRTGIRKALSQHSYSRYASPADYTTTTTEMNGAETFSFDKITAYSEFSSLYDRYRITAVQLNITLLNNPTATWALNDPGPVGSVKQNTTNWYPRFWYVRDYDDSSTITLDNMRERSGVKSFILQPNKSYKIVSRPAILNQTYRTSTTTGYSPKWRQWIDMAQPNVPHYGFKWILDTQGLDPNDSYPFKIRIEYRYFFTCKDVL